MIAARVLRAAALAALAGALRVADAAAQQPVPSDTARRARPDSARADTPRAPADTSGAARDTVPADSIPRDTMKAPLARAEMPALVGIGGDYRWERGAAFSSGAITLGDLLERIPGVTRMRPGWLASPDHASVLGDVSRLRVFYDGVEVDALDPRAGGVLDLNEVQLWTLEEVAIERGADEVRVYVRSWRVDRTSVNSRTDVLTGDEDTNLYRGFFGRRFRHGEAVQVAAQQYGYDARDSRFAGGDQLALLGRVGWAQPGWSVDAFALRTSRTRDEQLAFFNASLVIPRLKATRTDAYVRAAIGDPDGRAWAQLSAAHLAFDEKTPETTNDQADSSVSHAQYVATAGTTLGALRLSATGRAHVLTDETVTALSGRAAFAGKWLALSLYTEQRGGDTSSVEEAAARLSPLPWLAISGVVARRHGGRDDPPDALTARLEAGVRLGRFWTTGGLVVRDTTPRVAAPLLFDTAYAAFEDTARSTGYFGTIRGPVWRDVYADIWAIHWDKPGWYRPQTQLRAEIGVNTSWLSRFPSGNFGFIGSVAIDYRGQAPFPRTDLTTFGTTTLRQLQSRVEIRIVDGYIFWQQNLQLNPAQPTIVPGFVLPRQLAVFGARWQFWN